MEAGWRAIQAEEKRSARLGRGEDEKAEQEELARQKAKAAAKAAAKKKAVAGKKRVTKATRKRVA